MSEATELDHTQAVEVNMGEHSVLVLEVPGRLRMCNEQMSYLKEMASIAVRAPGRRVLVLMDGITCKVLHRPDLEGTGR